MSDLQKLRGQMRRFSVKPGLTGLWQVSGRSGTTVEERMRLDCESVDRPLLVSVRGALRR